MNRTLLAFCTGLGVIPLLFLIWAGWYGFYASPRARAFRYYRHHECPKAMAALEELLRRPSLSPEEQELYSNAWELCYLRLHPHSPAARKPPAGRNRQEPALVIKKGQLLYEDLNM